MSATGEAMDWPARHLLFALAASLLHLDLTGVPLPMVREIPNAPPTAIWPVALFSLMADANTDGRISRNELSSLWKELFPRHSAAPPAPAAAPKPRFAAHRFIKAGGPPAATSSAPAPSRRFEDALRQRFGADEGTR